mmetsp:Transcript_17235/g.31024  ORF Transcript_17235/g.31024 Transcript_17235/m.31024 type:complete len:269 (+) Transcript_17235:922-1728(+)
MRNCQKIFARSLRACFLNQGLQKIEKKTWKMFLLGFGLKSPMITQNLSLSRRSTSSCLSIQAKTQEIERRILKMSTPGCVRMGRTLLKILHHLKRQGLLMQDPELATPMKTLLRTIMVGQDLLGTLRRMKMCLIIGQETSDLSPKMAKRIPMTSLKQNGCATPIRRSLVFRMKTFHLIKLHNCLLFLSPRTQRSLDQMYLVIGQEFPMRMLLVSQMIAHHINQETFDLYLGMESLWKKTPMMQTGPGCQMRRCQVSLTKICHLKRLVK